ncbi:hypothetical protein AB1L88_20610 [Tautonia sp. JC769]|uniref:hypothetical protein n=1 Tax=Tautonia sp. JC769 TaxID=3232135 RepID=UPI003458D773
MPGIAKAFSRWHLGIFLGAWLGFAALTLQIVRTHLDNAERHPGVVAATTVGSVLGPMSGAISRGFSQGCCLEVSLSLLPYCLSALVAAAVVQVVVPARGVGLLALRLVAWMVGVIVWFGGGIVSLGHALS